LDTKKKAVKPHGDGYEGLNLKKKLFALEQAR
jgi:hypothetical protein